MLYQLTHSSFLLKSLPKLQSEPSLKIITTMIRARRLFLIVKNGGTTILVFSSLIIVSYIIYLCEVCVCLYYCSVGYYNSQLCLEYYLYYNSNPKVLR